MNPHVVITDRGRAGIHHYFGARTANVSESFRLTHHKGKCIAEWQRAPGWVEAVTFDGGRPLTDETVREVWTLLHG